MKKHNDGEYLRCSLLIVHLRDHQSSRSRTFLDKWLHKISKHSLSRPRTQLASRVQNLVPASSASLWLRHRTNMTTPASDSDSVKVRVQAQYSCFLSLVVAEPFLTRCYSSPRYARPPRWYPAYYMKFDLAVTEGRASASLDDFPVRWKLTMPRRMTASVAR
jgi:hypothetical protein